MNKPLAGVRILDLRHPDGSSARGPAHFSPAPLLGSDTDRVMTEPLDVTPQAVQALKAQGVIA